ncbi:VOC family protein [Diaminobutyricimonas sp. LJ205]|uniref:VOC family protein n=1 Tax=Diaminobutyricimonas sp. LJ205 TaxID=2683590 RepID=UPI0012F494D2|nr:VOC family protein [Diaminobutyricimonas sp. LJ205]
MLTHTQVFSSFSTDDIEAAKEFYGQKLGLKVADNQLGGIDITLASGGQVFVYPKDNHRPASFTVLHFGVEDVEKAVDELNSAGVQTKIYGDDELPDMPNDSKGIWRDENNLAMMAWFKDPAGNVLGLVGNNQEAIAAQEEMARRARQ